MKIKIKEKVRKAKAWAKEHKQGVVATIGSGVVSGVVFGVIHVLCNKKTGLGEMTYNDMYPCEIKIDGEPATAYVETDANKNVLGFWVDMKDRITTDGED